MKATILKATANIVDDAIQKNIDMFEDMKDDTVLHMQIRDVNKLVSDARASGNEVFIAGNGGSCCQSLQYENFLVEHFSDQKKSLRARALANTASLSSMPREEYQDVFARELRKRGNENDVFIGLTTSGNSPNIIRAIETAKMKKMRSVVLTGSNEGALKDYIKSIDVLMKAPAIGSARCQEAHSAIIYAPGGIQELPRYFKEYVKVLWLMKEKKENQSLSDKLCKVMGDLVNGQKNGQELLGRIFAVGNGDYMALADHFVEELVVRYQKNRPGIPAFSLSQPGVYTCAGNDFGKKSVYGRPLITCAEATDALFCFSHQGDDANMKEVIGAATQRNLDMDKIILTGNTGWNVSDKATILSVPSDVPHLVKFGQLLYLHLIVELLERNIYPELYENPKR